MLSVNSLVAHGHRTISSRTLGHPEKLWVAFGDRTTALQKHSSTTCIWQFRVLLKGYIAWKVKHGSRMKLVEIQTFTPGLLLPWSTCYPTWQRVRWSISTADAQISRDEIWLVNYENYVWGIPKCLQVRRWEGWFSIIFIFDKNSTHANTIDRMHVNARENELLINF